MGHFTIYSKTGCSYCVKAKQLLEQKNIGYTEVMIDVGQGKEEGKQYISVSELKSLIPGVSSVPQIFLDGSHIGGYNQLVNTLQPA